MKKLKFKLPEIPDSWIICIIVLGMIALRFFGIDGFVTAALSLVIGMELEKVRQAIKTKDLKIPLVSRAEIAY